MIKAIFFDNGEVLTNNPFERVVTKVAKNLNLKYEDIYEIRKEYIDKIMIGQMSIKDFNKILKNKFNLHFTEKEIYNIWSESYKTERTINKELYDVVAELKKRYIVGMISNTFDLW